MAWGSWMCVENTPELDFELQKSRVMITNASTEELREFALNTYSAWLLQQKLLKQATRHIAELECQAAIQDSQQMVPRRPWWWPF